MLGPSSSLFRRKKTLKLFLEQVYYLVSRCKMFQGDLILEVHQNFGRGGSKTNRVGMIHFVVMICYITFFHLGSSFLQCPLGCNRKIRNSLGFAISCWNITFLQGQGGQDKKILTEWGGPKARPMRSEFFILPDLPMQKCYSSIEQLK